MAKKHAPAKPAPKMTAKQAKAYAAAPVPPQPPAKRRGDPTIGQKRKAEARSAAIGRGIIGKM